MQIKIEFAKPAETSQKTGKQFTNLKSSDGTWYNVWGDHADKKGQTITIKEPQKFGKALWASIDKDAPPAQKLVEPTKLTIEKYKEFLDELFHHVVRMEGLTDAQAAIINTACIALTNGKIDIDQDN